MIIKRNLYHQIKPYLKSKQAIVVTGMRRTGKTTLMSSIYEEIESNNKLWIDLENPLNQKRFEEIDFDKIILFFQEKGIRLSQKAYVFLDEIQWVKNAPQVVKYLYDHYDIKFFLTGSSSFYLKNLFTESMAGRKFIFELFPLNFHEFLRLKGERLKYIEEKAISETTYLMFDRHYEEYLQFGGFPEVVMQESKEEKQKILDEIFSSYFQLEVNQLSDFQKKRVVRDLILLLGQRCGGKLDINRLASELGVHWNTVNEYIAFLEGTYFISLVHPFSKNKDIEIRKMPKVYYCDSGLLNRLVPVGEGPLFENNIFQLLRPQGEINYYQKKSGPEIDFILNKKRAYEVKLNATASDVRKLEGLVKKLNLENFQIISKKYSKNPQVIYPFCL